MEAQTAAAPTRSPALDARPGPRALPGHGIPRLCWVSMQMNKQDGSQEREDRQKQEGGEGGERRVG